MLIIFLKNKTKNMKKTPILFRGKKQNLSPELSSDINKFYSKDILFMSKEELTRLRRNLIDELYAINYNKKSSNVFWNRVTRESSRNVVEYLIGEDYNPNLFGTILGFKKSANSRFSFFLYLSHETGRIERILFNPCSDSDFHLEYSDLKSSILTYKDEIIQDNVQNENHIIENSEQKFHKFNQIINSNYPLRLLNLDHLNDGNINKVFFDSFIIELLRDYLWTFRSFSVTDMKFLKQFTNPIYQGNFKDVPYFIGCGETNLKELESYYKTQNINLTFSEFSEYFKWFNAFKFINYNYIKNNSQDNLLSINLPKAFNWKTTNTILNEYNFQAVSLEQSKVPQIIKDLKTYINSRTITDKFDLLAKVSKFNNRSFNKIMNIYTNGHFNPNMVIDNNNSIKLRIKPTTKRFEMEGYEAP
uniref:Uncharacterized protein n=1 Tax=Coniophora olivacea TaxID=85977 RepID=A0A896Z9I3_9AGAM